MKSNSNFVEVTSDVPMVINAVSPVDKVPLSSNGHKSDEPEETIENWPEEMGSAVLDDTRSFVSRYVVVPAPEYLDVITLWIAHSHVIKAADTTPRLLIKSPEKESGKSRLLEVLDLLVAAPLQVMNTTPPAIFRLLGQGPHTILFDEVDAVFAKAAEHYQDIRALLNAGYRRGAQVARVVGEAKKMDVKLFPVFAATALAAIGDLPDTIESRSIVIPMRRRVPDEALEPFRLREARQAAAPLQSRVAGFSAFSDQLASDRPVMPEGVTDRAADCWEILLAIADLAGGDWPKRAREAAVLITSGRVADDLSTGVRLLADIHAVVNPDKKDKKPAIDKIASAALVEKLNALDESPWGGWHDGKGMTQRDLAKRLKPYGIEPKAINPPDGPTFRGYRREQFTDPFSRYLRLGRLGVTTVTTVTPIRVQVTEVTEVTDTQEENEALSSEWPLSGPFRWEDETPPWSDDESEADTSLLDDSAFISLAEHQPVPSVEASIAQKVDAAKNDPFVAVILETYPGSRVIGVRPAIG